jgi:hypothetical protein
VSRIDVHGYAIVSRDDRIADAAGAMPAALRNDADWAYFQAELDRADFIAIGRVSHETTPNLRRRRRLVMSRAARGLETRDDALWWNPRELPFADLMQTLAPDGGRVAVPGGQAAFDLFLGVGYAGFHLSRATRVALPGGRGLFSICEHGTPAETALESAGLVAGPTSDIDRPAGVTLTVWRPGV